MVEEPFVASDHMSRQMDKHREPIQRPSSQPAPNSHRRKKPSPNHMPRKQANSQVISSIIASLDDIEPPIPQSSSYALVSSPDSPYSPSIISNDSLSRSSSRRTSFAPAPVLRRSISLGMDFSLYKTRIEEEYGEKVPEEEDDDDDAAAFPVIRTSRAPSGRSSHTATSSPSGSIKGFLPSLSRNSRSSLSLGAPDSGNKLGRSTSRLSIDSWSRRLSISSASQLSVEATVDTPKSSSLRPSQDTLKPATIREEHVAKVASSSTSITPIREATPPETPKLARTSPTGRLYMGDTVEDTVALSAKSVKPVKAADKPLPRTPNQASSKSSSPKRNPIADAIPLRVSSLNRIPSPRKDKAKLAKLDKGKRIASPFRKESSRRAPPEPLKNTAHDMFEGLDDEDTTVRRIRELQQKREDRLKKESVAADKRMLLGVPNSALLSTDAAADSRLDLVRSKSTPKTATKSSAREADVRKAHRVLGLDRASKPSGQSSTVLSNYLRSQENRSLSPEQNQPFPLNSPTQRTPSFSSASPNANPTLRQSLEEALADFEGDAALTQRVETKLRFLNGLDLDAPDLTPPSTSHSTLSRRSRSNSNNLDLSSHSDLPLEAESSNRSRRKSMSDARNERILEEEILAERRNSVNVSVDDYLSAPRLNQKIRHPQNGRLISFSEVGDPRGAAVIVCVGMGLTRFVSAFYDELAATLGLRLITLDRPGVAESEPYPERERVGPLSWPDDVVTVTQHLGISQFSILAHSAGAIYALATALILPHCIRGKVQLLAPWIPPSQFDTYGIKDRSADATRVGALPRSQRLLRVLPIPFFKAANGGLFSPSSLKPSSVRSSPTPSPSPGLRNKPKRRNEPLRRESMILVDQVVPERPITTMFPLPELVEDEMSGLEPLNRLSLNLNLTATAGPTDPDLTFVAEALDAAEHSARQRQSVYSTLLTERTWTMATRNSNPAVDLLVCLERHRDVGFRYVDIQRQIIITHGSEDKRVPVENIKWMGEQINRRAATNWSPDAKQEFRERGGCEVRVLQGEGHGLMASPSVMADVLAEIAREWTGARW